ncbi:hypothetical protein SAMN05880574_10129 [Chryseobacterium sp. RU37D]|nr:hypothetical protein SAMN05880574_10129 [Chryseobacterium sp. RU37D]
MNNPANYSDPTGLYSVSQGGDRIDLDPSEFGAFWKKYKHGIAGSGSMGSINSVFKEITTSDQYALNRDIPELIIQGSRLKHAFTGDYFFNSDKKAIFNHLNKNIGAMATITQWNGDRGFRGNWAAKLSYGMFNNFYLALQTVDTFNWLNGKSMSGYTGREAFSNIDGSSQFDSGDRLMAFSTTFNPFGPKMTLNVPFSFGQIGKSILPQSAFRMTEKLAPLNAAQFSSFFRGTAISRAAPVTRGFMNRYLNKGLNGVNSVGMYRTLYPIVAKSALPNNKHNNY